MQKNSEILNDRFALKKTKLHFNFQGNKIWGDFSGQRVIAAT
jgi:hypothetical protein